MDVNYTTPLQLSNLSSSLEEVTYINDDNDIEQITYSVHDISVITIGVIAVCMNLLLLIALQQVKLQLTTHHRLIISLAVSDIVVGGSVMLHVTNKLVNPLNRTETARDRLLSKCAFLSIKALNATGLNMTLLNLMAQAVDHYVAIILPLQYHVWMSRKRSIWVIAILWISSVLLGFSDFFSVIGFEYFYPKYSKFGLSYCEKVQASRYREEYTILAVAPICLGIIVYVYCRIYIKIHLYQRPGENINDNHYGRGKRTRKALVTTLLNIGTFILTWLPLCLYQLAMFLEVKYNPQRIRNNIWLYTQIDKYLFDLLMINAIADSIIYTCRVREVKLGLLRMGYCLLCRLKRRDSTGHSSATTLLTSRHRSEYSVSHQMVTTMKSSS